MLGLDLMDNQCIAPILQVYKDALYIHEDLQGAFCHGMIEEDAQIVEIKKKG